MLRMGRTCLRDQGPLYTPTPLGICATSRFLHSGQHIRDRRFRVQHDTFTLGACLSKLL